jgi:predicted deacylase
MKMATGIMEWIDVKALAPRSLHAFDFAVVRLADGSWLTVPVKVAVGNRPRPRLMALAGVHGDELEGMLSLLDFWDTCDPGRLQGTVILVPVANPPAFAAHQRRSPLDGLDLNRTFPGKADGTPSERLAYRLLHEVITGSDFVFTLHSWYATGMVAPYVEFIEGDDPVAARSLAAAKAAGFRRLRQGERPEGVLGRAAHRGRNRRPRHVHAGKPRRIPGSPDPPAATPGGPPRNSSAQSGPGIVRER